VREKFGAGGVSAGGGEGTREDVIRGVNGLWKVLLPKVLRRRKTCGGGRGEAVVRLYSGVIGDPDFQGREEHAGRGERRRGGECPVEGKIAWGECGNRYFS